MPLRNKTFSVLFTLSLLLALSLLIFDFFPPFKSKALEDTTPPDVVAIGFHPATINTEEGTDEVTIYARFTDDISGVVNNPNIEIEALEAIAYKNTTFILTLMTEGCDLLSLPEGLPAALTDGLDGECGTHNDGIYTATKEFPRYSTKGIWGVGTIEGERLGSIVTMDKTGNQKSALEEDSTISAYFTNNATIHDITPPVLKNITMSPTSFNSDLGAVDIEVILEISDDVSGVKEATVNIKPLIGSESAQSISFEKIGGTFLDGTFKLVVQIPQGSKTGFWEVQGVSILDNLDNWYSIQGFRSFAQQFPSLDLFLVNQAMKDEVTIDEDWVIEEWDDYGTNFYLTHPDMSIKFQAGTVVTKREGGIFAFHRMLTRKYNLSQYDNISTFFTQANQQLTTDLQSCTVEEGCFNAQLTDDNLAGEPVHILKFGVPGLNLSFSKPVIITIAVDDMHLGTTFVIQTFDHSTNTWTNETTCLVKTVEPESYEHGGTEFGSFMPAPYTACRFGVSHATFFSTNILGESDSPQAGVPNTGLGGPINYFRRIINNWL